jgi:hypothetical protein
LGEVGSPQFRQYLVPGGSFAWQCRQLKPALKSAPQEGQNFELAVTFFSHWKHFLMITI